MKKTTNATNTTCTFHVTDINEVKKKMLNWANQFSIFCLLDNHQYQIQPQQVECLLAAGAKRIISLPAGNALGKLQEFINSKPSWLFGHLAYDLKNEIESLTSKHKDHVGFPDLFFFEPQVLIHLNDREMIIEAGGNETSIFKEIIETEEENHLLSSKVSNIKQRVIREDYLSIINTIRNHILRGDCYELNFCQEFYSENTSINPVEVYKKLSEVSPNPFSALYKMEDRFLICASPERYLRKKGNMLLSQPIKGTSVRFTANEGLDEKSKDELYHSEKDRSENVMVVDIVRNDLSRVCIEGSVKVDELFGVYSFPQVHQMISTVSGELKQGVSFSEIIRASFPMGSMTGAPKRSVMQLIEKYEKTKRGIFSGAVGYIDPSGDFDLNVVIRSIMYNSSTRYVSFQAGSGITFYSDPVKEYEECMMKAEAIFKVLS